MAPHISLDFNPLDQVWPSKMPVNQSLKTGGPAAGGEALGYAAPGLGLPLGVVSTPPPKVPTFPEGKLGSAPCAADPPHSVQKSDFF